MSNEHIVPLPPFFFFLRIAQVLFTFIVFILACYGLAISDGAYGGNDYALFVTLASFIILGYYLLSSIWFPRAYNHWAVLVLECLANVWWLGAFASLAAWSVAWSHSGNWDYVIWRRSSIYGKAKSYRNAMAAAAGIGAINWVLFTMTLIVYGLNLHRHRKSGAPSRWNSKPREAQVGAEPLTYRKEYQYESQMQPPMPQQQAPAQLPAEQMH